jgi:hypothetical protein
VEYGGAADISNVVVISDSDLAPIPDGPALTVDEFKSALHNWEATIVQWLPESGPNNPKRRQDRAPGEGRSFSRERNRFQEIMISSGHHVISERKDS